MKTCTGWLRRSFLLAGVGLACAAGSASAQTPANACAQAPTVTAAGSYAGSTVGFTADGTSTCGSNSAPDAWIRFVSPVAGQVRFDTCSPATNFDTIIAVRTACPGSGSQLACNDDAVAGFCATDPNGVIGTSRALANLAAGQVVFVRIGAALPGISGDFVLNITTPPPPPPPTAGPDVTVFNLTDVARTGNATENGINITAYAVGTESCNRGDVPVSWYDAPGPRENQHPVIGQNVFRLKSFTQNGVTFQRFEQLGQSWLKHGFLSVNGNACGTCIQPPDGGDQLGVNCSDPYGSGLNGDPSLLGSRSRVNASTGFYAMPVVKGNSTGNAAIRGRAQVPTADVTGQPAGTRFYVDAQYVTQDDHQHVRPGQTVAQNSLNNATWREINIQGGTGTPTFIGANVQQQPGIFAWRAADAGVTLVSADHDDVPNPSVVFPNTTLRGRFWVAGKATSLGNGLWRYEYAIYNLNSDRSAGGFSVPFPADGVESDFFFRHPFSHSGEPFSNAAWTMTKANGRLTFSTESFAANQNANAIRWGTMYNVGFTSNVAPTTGNATINLFKPGANANAPASIEALALPVPTVPPSCAADFNGDGTANPDDLADYIACFFTQPPCEAADVNGDFNVDPDDLSDFIATYFAGC